MARLTNSKIREALLLVNVALLPIAWYGLNVLVWPAPVPIPYLLLPVLGLAGGAAGIWHLIMGEKEERADWSLAVDVGGILIGAIHLLLFGQILTRPVS